MSQGRKPFKRLSVLGDASHRAEAAVSMREPLNLFHQPPLILIALVLFAAAPAVRAADTLNWNTNQSRVSADIRSTPLFDVLERIAFVTGWHVFVEPDAARKVSAKFSDLPPGEALRLLVGDLNFAMVPSTNSNSRLYVFRTSRQNATHQLRAAKPGGAVAKVHVIANELVVRLKPGAKIEDIAHMLGAKVVGRIDSLNAYRLRFEDSDTTESARQQLASNAEVASVENNYFLERPENPQLVQGNVPPLNLQLNPPPDDGRIVIALIDTAVQSLGKNLDAFLQKQVSLAGEVQLDPNSPSHGTLMAETMLRTLQELGKGSSSVVIQPYDIYGASQNGNTFKLAEGIAKAVNDGAKLINLSLGSKDESPLVRDLIAQAYQKGITIYAAKGNDGPSTAPTFPAADNYVTAVTAVDRTGQVAAWANQANLTAVGAQGTVALPYNGQTFVTQGTSPATAIVTATAASLMEQSSLSAREANIQIRSTATPTTLPGK